MLTIKSRGNHNVNDGLRFKDRMVATKEVTNDVTN